MERDYFDNVLPHPKTTPFGIFVDQVGYSCKSTKRAVMAFECDEFYLVDENGNTVYKGKTNHYGFDAASEDIITLADFSDFSECGRYRVTANGQSSAAFEIGDHVYNKLLFDTSKAFYYLRCGCGLDEKHAGVYRHAKCHTAKAMLWADNDTLLDVFGGWHDAGDYGRYVTAGACAAAHLLYAYKLYPEVFERLELNIPETPLPDILSEVKYELDWLLKMQKSDGGVYHKVTTMLHAPFVMPEEDNEQLYVFEVSSMAVADLAAVMALACGIFKKFDSEYADKLFKAALLSIEWLELHPNFIGFNNPEGNNTGGYGQFNDNSNRYWAYAEMYALTKEQKYHDKIKELLGADFPLTALGYTELGGLGSLAYLTCDADKDLQLVKKLKKAFSERAAELKAKSDRSGYGVAMGKEDYHWGSNMAVMKNGMIFAINDLLNNDKECKAYAQKQLDYLLGVNALGISYVTGNGEFRCNYPHLRPAFADGIEECIPGMVSGGPNSWPADPIAKKLIKIGTPPMKCYADDTACYSLNEITIYWNSPTVFTLAYIISNSE